MCLFIVVIMDVNYVQGELVCGEIYGVNPGKFAREEQHAM